MKQKLTLLVALALGIALVSLVSWEWTVGAEPPQRFVFDTGLTKVGTGQLLRVSVAAGDFDGDGSVSGTDFVVRRFQYGQGPCTADGVCRQGIESQSVSDPMRLMPGQGASIVVDPSDPTGNTVRAMVVSNKRSSRVSASIIDTVTGKTVSQIIVANTDGDIH
ncbi:MAG TPA: hypothetical protein VJV05_08410 [Pyrinomonadaceae bacterium]|nr:hypothetical protein [Pyrinomonadaceae bacterium]